MLYFLKLGEQFYEVWEQIIDCVLLDLCSIFADLKSQKGSAMSSIRGYPSKSGEPYGTPYAYTSMPKLWSPWKRFKLSKTWFFVVLMSYWTLRSPKSFKSYVLLRWSAFLERRVHVLAYYIQITYTKVWNYPLTSSKGLKIQMTILRWI